MKMHQVQSAARQRSSTCLCPLRLCLVPVRAFALRAVWRSERGLGRGLIDAWLRVRGGGRVHGACTMLPAVLSAS